MAGRVRIVVRGSLAGAVIAAGLGLGGCVRSPPVVTGRSPETVTVAPRVTFRLPRPQTLGRTVEASQLITAHYGKDTFVFETSISVTPARLLVIGTDMLGRRAMTITWTGDALTEEAAPWVPAALKGDNVVADIILLHWPEAAVRAGLAPGGAIRDRGTERRIMTEDGKEMIRIDREAGTQHGWSGRWSYRNLAWHYALDIQSAEAEP